MKDWKHSTSRPFHYALHSSLAPSRYKSMALQHGPAALETVARLRRLGKRAGLQGAVSVCLMEWTGVCIINTGTDLELHEYSASVAFPQLNLDPHMKLPCRLVGHSRTHVFHKVTEGRLQK